MSTSNLWFGTSGPRDAEVVVVGEAWGAEEAKVQRPFVGGSGQELRRMLVEANLDPTQILFTNLLPAHPPANEMAAMFHPKEAGSTPFRRLYPGPEVLRGHSLLHEQLAAHPRRLVIACGNYPLWSLTPHFNITFVKPRGGAPRPVPIGINKWRGSMTFVEGTSTKLLPIIHPAAILRQWSLRAPTLHDLRTRVPLALRDDWRPVARRILAPPTFVEATTQLALWLQEASRASLPLAADIETARGHITCIGFASSPNLAMSIPFVTPQADGSWQSYWTNEQEARLIHLIRLLLTHKNVRLIGQNFTYDIQYIQHWWNFRPVCWLDTMLANHLLFPGTPKDLGYLSSLYCHYHWFWKDDGKEWDVKGDLGQHLRYNAEDCLRTIEIGLVLSRLISQMGQEAQWADLQATNLLALEMMNRGVRIDLHYRSSLLSRLLVVQSELEAELLSLIPQDIVAPESKTFWFRSPSQTKTVFADLLGFRIPTHRKTGEESTGKEAINELRKHYPGFARIFDLLADLRSVGVFLSHFVKAPLDPDQRMRCTFNVGGTETFRWSSSSNAFHRGTNLQNLPKGDD